MQQLVFEFCLIFRAFPGVFAAPAARLGRLSGRRDWDTSNCSSRKSAAQTVKKRRAAEVFKGCLKGVLRFLKVSGRGSLGNGPGLMFDRKKPATKAGHFYQLFALPGLLPRLNARIYNNQLRATSKAKAFALKAIRADSDRLVELKSREVWKLHFSP
ncbi:hypothetical protein [Leisingera sp. ANG-Vp]|uniref:hypothetical protein n=1 Tax=Leisingera sp. ANG-Vp TaxID=1577896 RepID=UPI00126A2BCE|nr:hypothetical protein [Leisingera sp. ANG-Vp]